MAALLMGLVILASALYIWSGSYNVAATEPHFEFVRRGLATIRDRSIQARAAKTEAQRLESAATTSGFRAYHGLCSICHSGPGLEASPIREGLNPKPPLLSSESVQRRNDVELFWIVKHGIKMTGMPAFGAHHDEQEIAAIAAFVSRLPGMTAEDYRRLMRSANRRASTVH